MGTSFMRLRCNILSFHSILHLLQHRNQSPPAPQHQTSLSTTFIQQTSQRRPTTFQGKPTFITCLSTRQLTMAQITSARSLYHECQTQGQCGKHTLNNLLQGPVFSIADLDIIAEDLRQVAQESLQKTMWKNPYKSPLYEEYCGMGYYDVSVLEAALNQRQCALSWFDARRDIQECLSQQDESMLGLIVHVPTSPRWVPFWKGQHWFGILRLPNGAFVDLDSRLSRPTPFAGFDDTISFLRNIQQHGGRLFLIHRYTPVNVPEEDPPRASSSLSTSTGTETLSTTTTTGTTDTGASSVDISSLSLEESKDDEV